VSKKEIHQRRYFGEFNRPQRDNIRACARKLERLGLRVERLRHETSLAIIRPTSMPWGEFLNAIRSILDPKLGSVMLFSQATGNAFRCDNRSNRPGRFVYV
jgi:hypothetical protein